MLRFPLAMLIHLLSGICFALAQPAFALAQPPFALAQPAIEFGKISVNGEIEAFGVIPGRFRSTVDFGKQLPCETMVEASILLKNTSSDTIIVSAIKTNCQCQNVSVMEGEYGPGKSVPIKVKFSTSKNGKSEVRFGLILLGKENQEVSILCLGHIEGYVGFLSTTFHAGIEGSSAGAKAQIAIPFEFTEPLKVTDIQAKASGSLEKLKIKVLADEKQAGIGLVKFDLDADSVGSSGIQGRIDLLKRGNENSVAFCICYIDAIPEIEFSPNPLVFQWKDGSQYEAWGILRVTEKCSADAVKLVASVADCNVDAKIKSIGSSGKVFRVSLQLTPKSVDTPLNDLSATLSFAVGKRGYSSEPKCIFFK